MLRKRISESNFYSKMAGFLKNGVLFNNALITCEYGGNELNFTNYDIFRNNVRVIDEDTIKRGFIQTQRHVTSLKEEYKTDKLDNYGEGYIDTYVLYLPIIDRYIKGAKPNPNDRFFSIEIFGNEILRRKDNIIPTFPTFPIHPFRPTNIRSMGQEALGPAIALREITFELHWRVKYTNNPSIRLPQEYFNKLRDALKKAPEDLIRERLAIPIPPGSEKGDFAAVKLENEIPVDLQYIQKLEHEIYHIFKAELIARSKLVGLSTAEAAQRDIGIHNELAPLMGHVVTNTAKNLIQRAVALLQANDATFQKAVGKRQLKIFTDFYLQNVEKQEKINKMMRFLEAVGGVGSLNPADIQGFKGHEFLEQLGSELEIQGVLSAPDELDQQRMAMSQAQTQPGVDEAKAEKDQADAMLKQAQAGQIEQGLV